MASANAGKNSEGTSPAVGHHRLMSGSIRAIDGVRTCVLIASSIVAWYFSLTPSAPLLVKVQNVFFFIAPPFSVIFCAGLLWRRATAPAALVTIGAGFAFSWMFDKVVKGQQGVYLHRAFFAWCFCVFTMVVTSLLTKAPPAEQVDPIIWTKRYADLPPDEKLKYGGWKDSRLWWGLFVGCILLIYGFFLWFRFQYPVPMMPAWWYGR